MERVAYLGMTSGYVQRPTVLAGRLACPILLQVGTNDRVASPDAARRAAKKAGRWAQLREYPVDHLDVYEGRWQRTALADQLEFLSSSIATISSRRQSSFAASA